MSKVCAKYTFFGQWTIPAKKKTFLNKLLGVSPP